MKTVTITASTRAEGQIGPSGTNPIQSPRQLHHPNTVPAVSAECQPPSGAPVVSRFIIARVTIPNGIGEHTNHTAYLTRRQAVPPRGRALSRTPQNTRKAFGPVTVSPSRRIYSASTQTRHELFKSPVGYTNQKEAPCGTTQISKNTYNGLRWVM